MLYESTVTSYLEGNDKPYLRNERGDAAMREAITFTRDKIAAAFPENRIPARRKPN